MLQDASLSRRRKGAPVCGSDDEETGVFAKRQLLKCLWRISWLDDAANVGISSRCQEKRID
jgi:hypothetical protein